MSRFDRRRFLKLAGVGAASAALVPLLGRKSARATPFGEFPAAAADKLLPADRRAKNILEVFLYGGLSSWESLYLVEEYGRPDAPVPEHRNTQFYAFDTNGAMTPAAGATRCGVPAGEPAGEFFAKDALGADVKLGPFARELRVRTDLVDRMRILCMSHDLEPHEAAIPMALTGKPVGSPTMAGLGTHIQRYLTETPDPARRSPYSYVFSTGGVPGDNVFAAFATGMHPGRARPLRIRFDNTERLTELLGRNALGGADERTQYDALLNAYATQYEDRLIFPGRGAPARSSRYADLRTAATAVANADAVKGVMEPQFFDPVQSTVCGDSETNHPLMSFKLAAHLLTHPTERASYVCVVDTGLIAASGGGGYDSHSDNSRDQARNLKNMFVQLTSIINAPGESDPRKLNLDDTLIILNTEFGRTPWAQTAQGVDNGRNHHPYGYATALIGGPVQGRGIVGAIGPDGRADAHHVKPSEARIAAMLSLGIWPFSPEAFGVSDVQDVATEIDGVEAVTQRVLGVV